MIRYLHLFTVKYLLLTVILFSVAGVCHALRVVHPTPDPWFVFDVIFDVSTLPEGIELAEDGLGLVNHTDTPLYIVRELESPMEWLGLLPNSVMPAKKLVSDKYYITFNRGNWRVSNAEGFHTINLRDLLSSHSIHDLQGPQGPGRPADAAVPAPVPLEFTGYSVHKESLWMAS